MIDIIITSYNEPKSTLRAVQSFLNPQFQEDYRIIVCDPFIEVKEFLENKIKDKKLIFFLDSGEGKSYALNLLMEKFPGTKDDFFIFTDGDVYVSDNTLSLVAEAFKDPNVGCVTGNPIPLDSRNTKYGYWSHLLFSGIHKVRSKLSKKDSFFECSGYLFAVRKSVINNFPLDVSEDSVIPYLFWKKGYKIKYIPEAKVYVKNPSNIKDWENQKIRNIKGHENLTSLFPKMPRTKSFTNEIKYGIFHTLSYPRNIRELFWTIQLLNARLRIYKKAFKELKNDNFYSDGWRDVETKTTRTLD